MYCRFTVVKFLEKLQKFLHEPWSIIWLIKNQLIIIVCVVVNHQFTISSSRQCSASNREPRTADCFVDSPEQFAYLWLSKSKFAMSAFFLLQSEDFPMTVKE